MSGVSRRKRRSFLLAGFIACLSALVAGCPGEAGDAGALFHAIRDKDNAALARALARRPDLAAKDAAGQTCLGTAAAAPPASYDAEAVRRALEKSRLPAVLPEDVVLPPGRSQPVGLPRGVAAVLRTRLNRLNAVAPIDADRAVLWYEAVPNAGFLLKLARREASDSIFSRFYFAPGKKETEVQAALQSLISSDRLAEFEKSILMTGLYALEAAKDL
ncbi:MAG: hypothetical protein JXD23_00735 [Spirochaetales bacterium]|nr:hypothetical protein [Spirochaetales bacterium]